MENEKKKLNKSSKDYTNSMAAYSCHSCYQETCAGTDTAQAYAEGTGNTLQLPYWR